MICKEGDIVLCTVKSIAGTTVFVHIEGDGDGSVITSEIASGRIRNLRDYVVPNKKIVCKVLRVIGDRIELSLRRVTAKEREDVMEIYKRELTSKSIISSISQQAIEKIKAKYESLSEFIESAKESQKILEEFFSKEEAERLLRIITEKKEHDVEIKKEFSLSSKAPEGIEKIKTLLKGLEISYLGGGKYSLKLKAKNFKEANQKAREILEKIESDAKKNKLLFEFKEK